MATAASIGGNVLTDLLTDGVEHLRYQDLSLEELQEWLEERFQRILDGGDDRAAALHGELVVAFHEIGARQAALEAAVQTGDTGMHDRLQEGLDQFEEWFAVLQVSLGGLHTKTDQVQQTLEDILTQLQNAFRSRGPLPDGGAPSGTAVAGLRPGRPLDEVMDPFHLEVHHSIRVDPGSGSAGLPMLPVYVRREHDRLLGEVVARAAEGVSQIAVLVGGSSTGKTRACWEALEPLRQARGWRLWHPIDPTRADAALAELAKIGPRTVVWLNEAQFYLADPVLGERVAAGLRELLRDPGRGPVLVLATVWPAHWNTLMTRTDPDAHSHARELLDGHQIQVPDNFTGPDLDALAGKADRIPG